MAELGRRVRQTPKLPEAPPPTARQVVARRRNLALRLARPAAGNGRVQKRAIWALFARNGDLSTSDVLEWTHATKRLLHQRIGDSERRNVRRVLDQIAQRIGRAGSIGRPILWRLK